MKSYKKIVSEAKESLEGKMSQYYKGKLKEEPKTMKHTPTPWQYIPSGKKVDQCFMIGTDSKKQCHGIAHTMDNNFVSKKISHERQEANAEFIVRACNAHEGLVNLISHISLDPYALTPDQWATEAREALKLAGEV